MQDQMDKLIRDINNLQKTQKAILNDLNQIIQSQNKLDTIIKKLDKHGLA